MVCKETKDGDNQSITPGTGIQTEKRVGVVGVPSSQSSHGSESRADVDISDELFSFLQPALLSSKEKTLVWIAANEDGVSILDHNTMQVHVTYPYSSVMTFGGCRDDFMLVIRSTPDQNSGKSHIEKLIFRMAAPKIAEATFILASYMNHCSAAGSPPTNPPAGCPPRELDGRQLFASVPCVAKGPALL